MPQFRKKGLIIDLAKKVAKGVKHAIEWEKEHLPKQKQWVKDEFKEAKKQYKAFREEFKKDPDAGKSPQQVDNEEVRDELDHDEDGTPDISMEELEMANKQIREDLDEIDLDDSGVPDHVEHEEKLFGAKIGEKARDIREQIVQTKAKEQQAKELIEAVGTEKEKMELVKHPDKIDVQQLSDRTLRQMAVRYKDPSFLLDRNPFKEELKRRMKTKAKIDEDIEKLQFELSKEKKEFKKKLRG